MDLPRRVSQLLLSSWVLVALFVARPVHADGMRCGGKLVSNGDTMLEVKNLCGAPHQAIQRVEMRTVRRWVDAPCTGGPGGVRCGYMEEQSVPVVLDEWTYDFGEHVLVRHLTFEAGRLIHLATGGYGSRPEESPDSGS